MLIRLSCSTSLLVEGRGVVDGRVESVIRRQIGCSACVVGSDRPETLGRGCVHGFDMSKSRESVARANDLIRPESWTKCRSVARFMIFHTALAF